MKYEEVHLKAYANGLEARIGIGQWFRFYNERRPHQALGYKTLVAAWAAGVSPVDLPLRLHDVGASPTTPQGQQQQSWYTSQEEERQPSPYEPTPVVLPLGSTIVVFSIVMTMSGFSRAHLDGYRAPINWCIA